MEWGKPTYRGEEMGNEKSFDVTRLKEQTDRLIILLEDIGVAPLPGTTGIYRIRPNTPGWIESVNLLEKDLSLLLDSERMGVDLFLLDEGTNRASPRASNSIEVLNALREDLKDIVNKGEIVKGSFSRVDKLRVMHGEIFKNKIYLEHQVTAPAFSLDASPKNEDGKDLFSISAFELRVFSVHAKESPLQVFEERKFDISTVTGVLNMELIHWEITHVHEGNEYKRSSA